MRFKIVLLLFLFLSSCSKGDNAGTLKFSLTDFPQTWELYSISAGLSGEVVNAAEIPVREIYVFKNDSIFSKEFKDEYTQGNLNGTYEVVSNKNRENLILTYEVAMDSLSYCSRDNTENMLILNNGQVLFNGRCSAFDGPAMSYQRIE